MQRTRAYSFIKRTIPPDFIIQMELRGLCSQAAQAVRALEKESAKIPNTPEEEQKMINENAPGSDMLANVDAFVIAMHYDIDARNGKRLSEIIEDYYLGANGGTPLRNRRCRYFCEAVGLKDWNGKTAKFGNEDEWLKDYEKQLRDNICFQVNSLLIPKSFASYWLPLRIWFNGYREVLKMDVLLKIWLDALKENLKKEPV